LREQRVDRNLPDVRQPVWRQPIVREGIEYDNARSAERATLFACGAERRLVESDVGKL